MWLSTYATACNKINKITGYKRNVFNNRIIRMSAPSKAKAIKLDNPAQIKVSHQSGTELHIMQGNEHYEAVVRAVYQPQRK